MIAFDTNLVVRLLVDDDAAQFERVTGLVEACAARNEPILLTPIVLAEVEWVLESRYRVPRRKVRESLVALLDQPPFFCADRAPLLEALADPRSARYELADLLIGVHAASAGASSTYTFDRALRRNPRFTLL